MTEVSGRTTALLEYDVWPNRTGWTCLKFVGITDEYLTFPITSQLGNADAATR